jgi:hypothetical protein
MQLLIFFLFFHYMFRLHAAIFRWLLIVAYRWTYLILNVNLVQQDATIQDKGVGLLSLACVYVLWEGAGTVYLWKYFFSQMLMGPKLSL